MPAIYITEQGATLGIDHQRLEVRKDGEVVAEFPMGHVERVVVLGNVTLTTPALRRLMAEGIDLVFMSLGGAYYGRITGEVTPHVSLRRAQYTAQGDPAFVLALAQRIVAGRIHNEKAFLQRQARRGTTALRTDNLDQSDPARHSAVQPPSDLDAVIADLDEAEARAGRTTTLNALRGVEGSATARYFGALRGLFGAHWGFDNRNRRPPRDPVNVMLSFGYTLLTRAAESAVKAVGLDPYVGFLHVDAYNRPSMALDLMEEMRVTIENLVWALVEEGEITPKDFRPAEDEDEPPVVMDREASKRFIKAYEARMRETRAHPRTGEQVARWRFLEMQAREVARCIQENAPSTYRALRFR